MRPDRRIADVKSVAETIMYNNFYEYKIDRFGYDHTWLDDQDKKEFVAKATNSCGDAEYRKDEFIERWSLNEYRKIYSNRMVTIKKHIPRGA